MVRYPDGSYKEMTWVRTDGGGWRNVSCILHNSGTIWVDTILQMRKDFSVAYRMTSDGVPIHSGTGFGTFDEAKAAVEFQIELRVNSPEFARPSERDDLKQRILDGRARRGVPPGYAG